VRPCCRRDGCPLTELIRVAETFRADAVVVGASRRLSRLTGLSIAARLLRAGRWPVIVVP
jgi:nucleotide-binding universal stress UspA family protein